MIEPLLTADEVAEIFKCSARQILEMARARELPSVKIGRFVRFERHAIERHISHNRQPEPERQL